MPIYMDYNATTPVAPSVVKMITESLQEDWGNPSSNYTLGVEARSHIEEARNYVACMIGAKPNDIIFTSGGTEANNTIICGIVNYFNTLKKSWNTEVTERENPLKPHVITTNVEHDATIHPLRHLERTDQIDVTFVPVSDTGRVSPEQIISHIRPHTCLVTVMMANNETGIVMPIAEIGLALQKVNKHRGLKILFHTDAAQTIGKIDVDINSLNVDYLTIVGHKFYGPRIGCLYVRDLHGDTPVFPLMFGGNQERGIRPGTENTAMIVGLGEAARLVQNNITADSNHMKTMRDYLEQKLEKAFGKNSVVFNCRSIDVERLPNTCNVSFTCKGLTGPRVLSKCKQLMASVGAACHKQSEPSGILLASGVPPALAANAIRLSVGRHTSEEEVDAVIEDLQMAVKLLRFDPNQNV